MLIFSLLDTSTLYQKKHCCKFCENIHLIIVFIYAMCHCHSVILESGIETFLTVFKCVASRQHILRCSLQAPLLWLSESTGLRIWLLVVCHKDKRNPPILSSFDLITVIILGEECKLWNFSLGSFLHPHLILYLLGPRRHVLKRMQSAYLPWC